MIKKLRNRAIRSLLVPVAILVIAGCDYMPRIPLPGILEEKQETADLRLAEELAARIDRLLSERRLHEGLVPLAALREAEGLRAGLPGLDAALYDDYGEKISREEIETRREIEEGKKRLAMRLPTEEKVETFRSIGPLVSSDPADSGRREFEMGILGSLYRQGEEAMDSGRWAGAEEIFDLLSRIDPGYRDALEKAGLARREKIRAGISDAIGGGKVDEAFHALQSLEGDPERQKIFAGMASELSDLMDYFIFRGGEADLRGELARAVGDFERVGQLRKTLGRDLSSLSQEEAAFLDQLFLNALQAEEEGRLGHALGYLFFVEDLVPSYPDLASSLRGLWEKIEDRAIKRVAVLSFESPGEYPGVGPLISAVTGEYLFEHAAGNFLIVERGTLQSTLREQEIQALMEGSRVRIPAADLLVQGRAVQARVEKSVTRVRTVKRVVTDHSQVENPAFRDWMKLGPEERRGRTAPPKSLDEAVTEDLPFHALVQRKFGLVVATFSLVDSRTGKVLHVDTVRASEKYQDEGAEGVQVGEFSLAARAAELPSDLEILTQLGEEVALEVGKTIAALAEKPEERYLGQAERSFEERSFAPASEQLANALVLTERRKLPWEPLRAKLKAYVEASHKYQSQ